MLVDHRACEIKQTEVRACPDLCEQHGMAAPRAAMLADPELKAYQTPNAEGGLLVEQNTSLMIPAFFAPIRR